MGWALLCCTFHLIFPWFLVVARLVCLAHNGPSCLRSLFYYEYQSNYICITWLCLLDHSCLDHSRLLTYALSTNFSLLKGKNWNWEILIQPEFFSWIERGYVTQGANAVAIFCQVAEDTEKVGLERERKKKQVMERSRDKRVCGQEYLMSHF